MTDRERLIDLIKKAGKQESIDFLTADLDEAIDMSGGTQFNGSVEYLSDYLISNGIIVPLCNVGDTVYRPSKYLGVVQFVITSFYMYQSEMFFTDDSDNIICLPDIGKTVFLTRKEAERALEEGENK